MHGSKHAAGLGGLDGGRAAVHDRDRGGGDAPRSAATGSLEPGFRRSFGSDSRPSSPSSSTTETHGGDDRVRDRAPRQPPAAAGAELTVLRSLLDEELRGAGGGRRRLGHPPVHDLGGDRALARRPLPLHPRDDARARAARADVRHARPRRRGRSRARNRDARTGCAFTCRCCSRCRRTRPSGWGGTADSPRLGRRSSRRFPRTGIPRAFDGYDDYVRTLATLIESGAFPEPELRLVGPAPAVRATARSRSG